MGRDDDDRRRRERSRSADRDRGKRRRGEDSYRGGSRRRRDSPEADRPAAVKSKRPPPPEKGRRRRRKEDEDVVEKEQEEEEEVIDEDALAALDDDEDEETKAARLQAERKAKRAAIMAKHQERKPEEELTPPREETPPPPAPEEKKPDEDDATLRYKVTELGIVEERIDTGSFDMFGNEEAPEEEREDSKARRAIGRRATAAQLLADELGEHEQANWDDVEGYYMARPGEIIDGKYRVLGVVGRGVFSSVLKAQDETSEEKAYVAVKMIRNNETMIKAAVKEIELLREIAAADPENRYHCVNLKHECEHRAHTALVFESMSMNLREALKKFGKHVGINISAVRSYTKQLLLALRHLNKLRIVHADIKPDNILVSEGNAVLKLCDFGSAFRETDAGCSDPAPYLVSRFYRAPEIILGLKYDTRIDLWSVATCLYELYTGHIMFPGLDNNNMLRLNCELKGRFPVKMLKAHTRAYTEMLILEPHFVELQSTFKFQHRVIDDRTQEPRLVLIDIVKPTKSIAQTFLDKKAGADDRRTVLDLADFLEQSCSLNPEHRPSIIDCLKHKFVVGRVDPNAKKEPKPASSDKSSARFAV